MRGKRVVRVNGFVFESHPDHHQNRLYVLGPEGIKDWIGGGTVRREEVVRAGSIGAYDLPGFLTQKVIPMSGSLIASSAAELQHMIRAIKGLGAGGAVMRVVVDDDIGSSWRDVRLAVQASTKELDQTSADFTLSFWAADPRAFGEARRFTAGTPAYHYGSFEARPIYEVTGSGSGYTLSAGGRSFVVTTSLPSGQKDLIDMDTGRVMRNGVLLVGGVSSAVTWGIASGQQLTHSITGASAAVAVVTDTWT